ncbi:hypothetical protein GW17_00059068, partial [Ensete ventricosum]
TYMGDCKLPRSTGERAMQDATSCMITRSGEHPSRTNRWDPVPRGPLTPCGAGVRPGRTRVRPEGRHDIPPDLFGSTPNSEKRAQDQRPAP